MNKNYFEYKTCADLARDTLKLLPYAANCAGVVGIPRSGMIPAGILSAKLGLPLYQITKDGLTLLGNGVRGVKPYGSKYFVVDDSTHDGGSIKNARQWMKHDAIFAAVYSIKNTCADVYAVHVDPHLFEWNLFNNPLVWGGAYDPQLRGGICFDFDGVLCEDTPFKHTDANEDKVIEWILNAKPRHLVRNVEIPTIISFRLEKHRKYIQQWLDLHEVKVQNLILHPAPTFRARDADFNVINHKAKRLKESNHFCMVESCPIQAKMIAAFAKKPVICTDTGQVFWW